MPLVSTAKGMPKQTTELHGDSTELKSETNMWAAFKEPEGTWPTYSLVSRC